MSSPPAKRFVGALSEELHALKPDGHARHFPAGHVIFSAGDPGDGFYVVESGRVQIMRQRRPGRAPGAGHHRGRRFFR
ncbi:MAG: cyclic nucleotide-binding domain-containing protein [Opitutus sp.]|nr:cyclic nucleotide-binding domain-containing protein [Opitutus sp.]